jgi:hypothetical protein
MDEGWYGEDYLILFAEAEIAGAAERYGISPQLPGYQVLGLRSWDDFILRDSIGHTHVVPTVPAVPEHLAPFAVPREPILQPDERYRGNIKWYVNPIVFGGDPNAGENLIWVSHEQHAQLVKWWNERHRSVVRSRPE